MGKPTTTRNTHNNPVCHNWQEKKREPGGYEKEAKERQKAGGGDRKSSSAKTGPVSLPEAIGDSRDKAGKAVGGQIPYGYPIRSKTSDMLFRFGGGGEKTATIGKRSLQDVTVN